MFMTGCVVLVTSSCPTKTLTGYDVLVCQVVMTDISNNVIFALQMS